MLSNIINFIMSFFRTKSETPEIDAKIKDKKKKIKELDKELKEGYDSVDEALDEWE